jgi:signal transduction histidine kinase/ligand-binding sensor domain-containing protein
VACFRICFFLAPLALATLSAGVAQVQQAVPAQPESILNYFTLKRWGARDGLAEGSVNRIIQSPTGFIYITTLHQITRFDGVDFLSPGEDPPWKGVGGVLFGSFITKEGDFWVYGMDGAWVHRGGRWITPLFSNLPRTVVGISQQKKLWIVRPAGISEWDGTEMKEPLRPAGVTNAWRVVASASSPDGGPVYVSHTGRIWSFRDGIFQEIDLPEALRKTGVFNLAASAKGLLVHGGGRRFWSFDGEQWVKLPDAPEVPFGGLLQTRSGEVWLGTEKAVLRFADGMWQQLTATQAGGGPLDARTLFEDSEGGIWIGTSDGLIRLNPAVVGAVLPRHGLTGQPGAAVLALSMTPAGEVLAGLSSGGLLAGNTQSLNRFVEGIPETTLVSSLEVEEDGTIWAGSQGDYLRARQDGVWRIFRQMPGGASARGVQALLRDSQGRLWAGTWDGLMMLKDNGLSPVGVATNRPGSLSHLLDTVQCLLEDRVGNIWAGYRSEGLLRIQPNGQQTRYRIPEGLPSNTIQALLEDEDGSIWAATPRGAAWFNSGQWRLSPLPERDIRQIQTEGNGHFWFGTGNGLLRVDNPRDPKQIRRFGLQDGMPGLDCTGGYGETSLRDPKGHLWFATASGIATVDPARFPNTSEQPLPVYLQQAMSGNKTLWQRPFFPASQDVVPLVLRPGTDSRGIRFQFSAPSYADAQSIQFRHRLTGFESAWSEWSPSRHAEFLRLPPGDYTFELEAVTASGRVGTLDAPVKLRVEPGIWETTWMRTAMAMLALGVTAGFIMLIERRRYRLAKERIQMKHAVERERARMAADLHDDLGAGLTEISLLAAMVRRGGDVNQPNQGLLAEINDRTREMVEALDEIVWAVDPRHDSLESLTSYLSSYASRIFSLANIRLRLDVASDLPANQLPPDRRHSLFLAFREAISNILRHAKATEVRLQIHLHETKLRIALADDGIGFAPDGMQEQGADGLNNLKRRLEQAGGVCQVTSHPGKGTTVEFLLPLSPDRAKSGSL